LNSGNIIKTFKSVNKYGLLMRRMIHGCKDKTLDDLIRSRGPNVKLGKSVNRNKMESDINFYLKFMENESDCCVCMHYDFEDVGTIVFCDSCNVAIHPECYGLKDIPEGDYFCNACVNKIEPVCILCKRNKGAFKHVDGDKWAHVFCILLSNYYYFTDYENMSNIVGSLDTDLGHHCKICSSNEGEIFTCSCGADCHIHPLCAFLEGYRFRISEKEYKSDKYPAFNKLYPLIYCDSDKTNNKRIRELTYYKEQKKQSKYKINKTIQLRKI
jgi:hypothetical protein